MRILLLSTGGTIAMDKPEQSNSSSFSVDIASFRSFLPLDKDDSLDYLDYSCVPSASINSKYAQNLLEVIKEKSQVYDGIIITHGTDTMEETAFYTEMVFQEEIPVLFTGSIRTKDQEGYDGLMNLQDAVTLLKNFDPPDGGVFTVFNKDIISPLHGSKIESQRHNAFGSIQTGKIGSINGGSAYLYYAPKKHLHFSNRIEGTSGIVKLHFDIEETFLHNALENLDITIIECFGSGRVPPRLFPIIKEYSEKKLIIMCSRAHSGHLHDEYGTLGSYNSFTKRRVIFSPLDSIKSSILAKLCLGNKKTFEEIKTIFEQFWIPS